MKRIIVAVLAVAAAAPAMASDFRFSYSPGDLASADRVQRLHTRLERAADEFCRREHQGRISATRLCQSALVEDAIRQIDSPQLTARLEEDVRSTPTT